MHPTIASYWSVKENSPLKTCVANVNWTHIMTVSFFKAPGIRDGYVLPLFSVPIPYVGHDHSSALGQKGFVTEAVLDLLATNCIMKVAERPFICSPCQLWKDPVRRLVINLRRLNIFLWKQKRTWGLLLFERGDIFDLKSGYHHVDIYESCWKYLGFRWDLEEIKSYLVFKVLPFGLSSACYFFTKLLWQVLEESGL